RHFQAIRDAGVERVSLRLFEGGRHEMLNETNGEEVREFILSLCPAPCHRHDKALTGAVHPVPS
ncbi:MAG: alpha/beta hydrolase, partial [Marinobacter alexandrii]